jgi:4-amino-4-deoxy-L-arabinose transferase-like glycosyltransferase
MKNIISLQGINPQAVKLSRLRAGIIIVSVSILLFLCLFHLTSFPTTWYDEGSHLHVPKTLLLSGVYADKSSEGFRYYGPTVGVGPTVMLPIAASFWLFGIGLLQARLVMVGYLLATIFAFYYFVKYFQGDRVSIIATALLVTSRGVSILENGRQVLGEVPGFLFLILGLYLWYQSCSKKGLRYLIVSGIFLGLAMITKYQYVVVVAPSLIIAWLANLIYYRTSPQKNFIVTGAVAAACFLLWQVILILYLGPATAQQNFNSLRIATAGAALVFSISLMKASIQALLSFKVYFSLLFVTWLYGFFLSIRRTQEGQKWGILFIMVSINLAWYVVASIGWLRYAFPALAISSIFLAKLFSDVADALQFQVPALLSEIRSKGLASTRQLLGGVFSIYLLLMIALPLAQTTKDIVLPPFNAPFAMAEYMNANIPQNVVIETWEPEMGFLTNHDYHFPPQLLLNTAISYIWRGGPSPAESYTFLQPTPPQYVLVGGFSTWVNVYPQDELQKYYKLIKQIGGYELYSLR